jgi:FkbM family methyltransferase
MFTSALRWLSANFLALVQSGWVLLSPPFLRSQFLFSLRLRRVIRLKIESYYDWATVLEIFGRREYDTFRFTAHTDIEGHFKKLSQTGTALIVDLGANVGIASSYFAQNYPQAAIVAVEPSSKNLELLKVNTMKTPLVKVVHGAVGASAGKVDLFDSGAGNNAFRTFGDLSQVTETIDCFSVSDLIAANPDTIPFLIKIDIEGAEKDLFSGNTDWIDSFKVMVVETHDWMLPGQAVSSNFLAALGGRKRDLIFQGENLFSIRVDLLSAVKPQ